MDRRRIANTLQLAVALMLGVSASLAIFGILRRFERFRAETNFHQLAGQRLAGISTRVTGALDTVEFLASHFEVSARTTRAQFQTLVTPALASHRYLQALEWIPWVPQDGRPRCEALVRSEGLAGFRFTQRNPAGGMEPAAPRVEYFPVLYVEPMAGNERAVGYDLASDTVRAQGIQRARATGRPAATARVLLVQEQGDQYGVLLFAPVYDRTGKPGAGSPRLKGFALGVVRIADLIAGAERSRNSAVAIHVFDLSAGTAEQLYPKVGESSPAALRRELHVENRFELGGRMWAFVATRAASAPDLSPSLFLVLAFGLLVTGGFVLHLRSNARQAERSAAAAEELRVVNEHLESHARALAEQARLAALGSATGLVLTDRGDLAGTLRRCAATLVEHLDAAFARIWTLREGEGVLELQASAGICTPVDGADARIPVGAFKIGRIARDRRPHLTNCMPDDPEAAEADWARREGIVSFAGYPLVVEGRLVGVVALFARRFLADNVLQSLASIADEIALGIERKKAEAALRASEQRFRIAAENASDVIVVRDLLTGRVETSGAEHRLLPSGRRMPRTFAEFESLLHPEDRSRVKAAIEAHLQENVPYRQEFRVIDSDGSVRHWCVRGTALRDPSGKAAQMIAVNTDITEQKETEAALSHLAAIVESSDTSIISIDLQGTILTWNRAAETIYGYRADEIKGRSIALIYPQDRRDELAGLLQKISRGQGILHIETLRVRKNGGTIPVFATYSPLRDAGGRIVGACSIAADITQRKLLERQLAQAQKLESIGQLAAGIAHEINTPIQYVGDNLRFLRDAFARLEQTVKGYDRTLASLRAEAPGASWIADMDALAETTRPAYLRAEIPQSLADALDGAGRVAEIVRAVKEFSHPVEAEKSPLDLNRAIQSTVLVSRNEWKYVAELQTSLDPTLPPVMCLPGEFNQVILNLIVNAAHAVGDAVAGNSGAKGEIVVSTRRDGDWAEVRVRDSGTGIPEEVQPKIFNPFFTTKGVGKGTGQGLAIAYSVIVQKHGGAITFETAAGEGTEFLVRLPISGLPEGSPASQSAISTARDLSPAMQRS